MQRNIKTFQFFGWVTRKSWKVFNTISLWDRFWFFNRSWDCSNPISLISGLATSNSIFIIMMIVDKSVPALFKEVLELDKKNHYTEPIVYPLVHAFYNISIYLITLMAFERYMCVCWPQKSKSIVTLKKTKIYIICCVFVGLIFTIPRLKSIQDLNFK